METLIKDNCSWSPPRQFKLNF